LLKAKVAISQGNDVETQVNRIVDLLGGIEKYVKKGQSVMLKPNVTGPAPIERGVTTNPAVIEAVLKLVIKAGAGKITIGDGTGSATLGTLKVFELCGYSYLKDKYDFEFLDLNRQKKRAVPVPDPYIMDSINMIECCYGYDVIVNLPVLKTHFITGVSLSLKNMKGCVPPTEKRLMHDLGVNKAVADLNSIINPHFTIVDGTIGSEGLGPKEGHPVGLKVVLGGTDVVAVDSVCCAVMGFDAHEIEHIRLVYEKGKGVLELEEIEVVGDTIEKVHKNFAPAIPTIPAGSNIINGKACSGCISCAVISLSRLADSGILNRLAERGIFPTFAIGPELSKDQEWPEAKNLFVVGNCAKHMAERGNYIPGCAPACLDVNRMISEYYDIDSAVLEVIVGDVSR